MRFLGLACVLAAAGGFAAEAQEETLAAATHAHANIARRNVFGQKPPPPPPPIEVPVEPPKEKPDFFLTGFTSIRGEKRAFVAFQRKGGAMQHPAPLILGVTDDLKTLNGDPSGEEASGEKTESIALLEINEDEDSVRIAYNGEEITLNFQENGLKAATAPAVPGGPAGLPSIQPNGPKGSVPPPPIPALGAPFNGTQPAQNFGGGANNSGPTVVGRGGQVLEGFGNNSGLNSGFNMGLNSGAPAATFGNNGLPAVQAGGNAGRGTEVQAVQPGPNEFGGTLPANPARSPRQAPPAPFPSFPTRN